MIIIKDFLEKNFGELKFNEEEHRYFLGGEELVSVSTFSSRWNATDFKKVAEDCSRRYNKPASVYLESWAKKGEIACDEGHYVHMIGECITRLNMGEDVSTLPDDVQPLVKDGEIVKLPGTLNKKVYGKCVAVKKFLKELPENLVPVAVESKIHTKGYKSNYAGTFDLLLYDKEKDGYIIADYKTNKDLYGSFANFKFLLSDFCFLPDNSIGHYTIQQSCYQVPLEDAGLNIIGRRLVWLKENGSYEIVPLMDVTEQIRYILNS